VEFPAISYQSFSELLPRVLKIGKLGVQPCLVTTRTNGTFLMWRRLVKARTAEPGPPSCHKRATSRGQSRSTRVTPDHGWPQVKSWTRASFEGSQALDARSIPVTRSIPLSQFIHAVRQ
jgi:hypothetical protein